MKALITRPCEYMGRQYDLGDEIEDDEDAHKLVRLGFAGWPDPDEAPLPSTLAPIAQVGSTEFDPAEHKPPEVLDHARAHPAELSALIQREVDGKNRVTVVTALTQLLDSSQGD